MSGLKDTDLGTDLIRKAFNETDGPLRDEKLVVSERQAISHLFAGAIGIFKNPQSHRPVALSDPLEAVEMILLANNYCGWSKPRQGQLAGTGRRMQRSVPTGNREIPSKL